MLPISRKTTTQHTSVVQSTMPQKVSSNLYHENQQHLKKKEWQSFCIVISVLSWVHLFQHLVRLNHKRHCFTHLITTITTTRCYLWQADNMVSCKFEIYHFKAGAFFLTHSVDNHTASNQWCLNHKYKHQLLIYCVLISQYIFWHKVSNKHLDW